MRKLGLLTVLVQLVLWGCVAPNSSIEDLLPRFKEGDLASSLEAKLHVSKHPSAFTHNLPPGEGHIIYFFPNGNLHVMTKLGPDGRNMLSPAPFFIPDATPVAKRVDINNQAWSDYVGARTGK